MTGGARDRLWSAAVALTIGTAVIIASVGFLLGRDELPIVPLDRSPDRLVLNEGESVLYSVSVPGGILDGLTLFADDVQLRHRVVRVEVLAPSGTVLARGTASRATAPRDVLRVEIPFSRWERPGRSPVGIRVSLVRGPSLPLRVRTGDDAGGVLSHSTGTTQRGDLAMSFLRAQRVSPAERIGVLAGVAVLAGTLLLYFCTRERWRWTVAAALLVIIAPVALPGFWFSEGDWGISDWDYYFSLHETYRESILTYRSLPFWNPYICGGTAGVGDPEFSVVSPTFPLELAFGVPTGLRLAIYVSTITGSLGMLALARRMRLSALAGLVAALAAFYGSVNLLEVVEGHVNIFAAMWIPWVFWAWLGAYREYPALSVPRSPRSVGSLFRDLGSFRHILLGMFLALTFFQGGIYLLFYTLFAFLVLPLLVTRPFRAVWVVAVGGFWAIALAAVKLLPVLVWLWEFPDQSYASSTFTLPWLGEILLGRYLHGVEVLPYQETAWHEYGAYVGPLVLGLALVGLARLRLRLVRGVGIAVVLALLLSSAGPLLKPLFDLIPIIPRSNISRVVFFAVFPLALLAGVGIDVLTRQRRAVVLLLPVLVGLVAVDLFTLSVPLSKQAFVLPAVVPLPSPAVPPIEFTRRDFSVERDGVRQTRAYAAILAGYGTLTYCSVLGPPPLVRTIHDEGNRSAVTIVRGRGTAGLIAWSPNRVRVRVESPETATVVLNTNFAQGWRANGSPAESVDGRVGTQVAAGTSEVEFVYVPPAIWVGVFTTLGTLALAVGRLRMKMRA